MRLCHAALVALLLILAGPGAPAFAQDGNSFSNMLEGLLRGSKDDAAPEQGAMRRVPFSAGEMQLSFAPLVRETAPAVVNVYAARQVQQRSPFAGDPFFEQFFGQRFNAPPRVQSSLGSGVIVDASGLVVTNNHVIAGADEVKVALADGREFESTILLKDEQLDLAVLKIADDAPFPVLSIGDSDALEVGDLVLAIGNPFGVGQTTTTGIVSALARSHVGVSDFGFFIQTDAAINPGNSGGALIGMDGALIGINTAIFTRSGGSNGIGFAIPSNIVRAFVRTAQNGGEAFQRPWIGASFDQVTPAIAESLGMRRPLGAIVTDVTEDGPADKAGIKAGDVVTRIGRHAIEHPDALGYRISTAAFGDTVELGVLRQGRERSVEVTLAKPPEEKEQDALIIEGSSPFAGAAVVDMSPVLARRMRLKAYEQGALITSIASGSPAARFGFEPGDIVLELSGETIRDARDMYRLASEEGRWWRFKIDRRGQIISQVLRY